ncbi:MAG: acyl-CoA dehydrogenase, partial [Gammaproteobacteria bacterium]|nr:acyl-CoA dehydrogenase [Gammaproteobacteria bacterium]
MVSALWLLLFVSLVLWLAYQRASFAKATIVLGVLLAGYTLLGAGPLWWKAVLWVLFTPQLLLNVLPLRRSLISRRFLRVYKRMLPSMSTTEREALEAGTVWWDGELFTGGPDWNKLLSAKAPVLTAEEQAFIDGPCEDLCRMIDDWDITHRRADLPPEVFDFIKKKGFWAMIIPKKFG